MAQKLLSETPIIKLHIALFFLVAFIGLGNQITAQTVLKPGDIVVVSVNADANSVDVMPLIDIAEGTTFYLADGNWNDSTRSISGNVVELTALSPIQAGTNLSLLSPSDSLFDLSGNLAFNEAPYNLFAYQKNENRLNFIYAVGWGGENVWDLYADSTGNNSKLPADLKTNPSTYLSLSEEPNQQYYIRNGASGTKRMLTSLIADRSNWRGGEEVFDPSGISFNVLDGPVVQFKSTLSDIQENDSTASLEVAIFEHDGSRLKVDLMLDTLRSLANVEDFGGFRKATINFTGIVGDYVHTIELPIKDNTVFNGRKVGLFNLENLTMGDFGDFRFHNLIIEDNEQPNAIISKVFSSGNENSFVEITNLELVPLSLSKWVLSTKDTEYTIHENVVIPPGQSVQWYDGKIPGSPSVQDNIVYSNLGTTLLKKEGGLLYLKDHRGTIIHQVLYDKKSEQIASKSSVNATNLALKDLSGNTRAKASGSLESVTSALELSTPGWKVLPVWNELDQSISEKEFFIWSENQQQFESAKDLQNNSTGMILGYFEAGEYDEFFPNISQSLSEELNKQNLQINLSATDKNGNDVIDGLEGLNLVFNSLNEEFTVVAFITAIETKYPKLKMHPVVYGVEFENTGRLSFKALETDDIVSPNAPLWIMLNSAAQNMDIKIDGTLLSKNTDTQNGGSEEQKDGQIILTLSAKDDSKSVQINFTEEENIKRIRDLNSYPQLQLPDQEVLQFSFKQSEDFFEKLSMPLDMDRSMQIPVYFGGFDIEKFSMSILEWNAIPNGWNIILRDLFTGKEYTVNRSFSLEFEHTFAASGNESANKTDVIADQQREDQRFVLEIIPEGLALDEEQEEVTDKPEEIELYQNYPNPFNPITTISFYLPESQEVRLSVFNIVGQPITVIVEGTLSAGQKQFDWDATDKPSGMYIYQLEVGNRVMTRKMTLVK